jgi:hypothetical protein
VIEEWSLEAGASTSRANTGATPAFLLKFMSVGEFVGYKGFQSL